MKYLKVLILCLFSLASVLLVFLAWLGMFSTLHVQEQETGPYLFVYEPFQGPYHKTKPAFDKVYEGLKKAGIEAQRGFGVYYDKPGTVPEEKLRSDCGALLEGAAAARRAEVEKLFKVRVIEKRPSLVTEFPIRNGLSYMFGPIKAYAALGKAFEARKATLALSCELYDMPGKKIYYIAQLEAKR